MDELEKMILKCSFYCIFYTFVRGELRPKDDDDVTALYARNLENT